MSEGARDGMRRITEPQAKALAWLPSDGSWRVRQPGFGRGIDSLSLRSEKLIEIEFGRFGAKGGWGQRARLSARMPPGSPWPRRAPSWQVIDLGYGPERRRFTWSTFDAWPELWAALEAYRRRR